MKKLATLVAGVLLVGSMAFAGSAVEVKSADGTATLRVGGQVGGNFSATMKSVKPKSGDAVGSTSAQFNKESDYQIKVKLTKNVANFEAQVGINEDTYLKYKLNDATSVKYQYLGDVVKLGDHYTAVVTPIEGLSAEMKLSDALTAKAGLAFKGDSSLNGNHIQYGVKAGAEMKSGADTTIIGEFALANMATGDKNLLGLGARLATKVGTMGVNGEFKYEANGATEVNTIGLYGKVNPAPIRVEAEVILNDGAKDSTTLSVTPGIEGDIGNGLIAFAEVNLKLQSVKDVSDTTSITPKVAMKYEF